MADRPVDGTLCVHGGEPNKKVMDAVTTPVALTATYAFDDTAELVAYFEGQRAREEYGRYGNPTVRAAEQKIAALDGAQDALLFASGMAAVTTTLLAMLKKDQHVVLTSDCYRRTRQFVTGHLARFGVESTLVEPGDLAGLERAIIPGRTRLLIAESPTNPYLRVADLEAMAAVKKRHPPLKLLIDSTFATPVLQRPLSLGADLVLHSCTKYLGGHNDLLAGSISGAAPLIAAIREFRGVLGGVLDPHPAYLLNRGMKTLQLRVQRQSATALQLARWLEGHPQIERVYYPGLESHPDHTIAARQMSGYGGVVSFLVKGALGQASRVIDRSKLCTLAPSLGGVESLIEQPALMSFYELTTEQREQIGIKDNLIRLSVGLEEAADLQADLAQALE